MVAMAHDLTKHLLQRKGVDVRKGGDLTALVACSSRTTTPRERALSQLPASAQMVAAADGPRWLHLAFAA